MANLREVSVVYIPLPSASFQPHEPFGSSMHVVVSRELELWSHTQCYELFGVPRKEEAQKNSIVAIFKRSSAQPMNPFATPFRFGKVHPWKSSRIRPLFQYVRRRSYYA